MPDINDLTQNVNIWDEAKAKAVSIITDGLTERLAVETVLNNDSNIVTGHQYSVVIDALSIGTSSQIPFFLIKNPLASGKVIKILEFIYSTTASPTTIRFYRDPTIITNGTGLTPTNFLKSGIASVATTFRTPTISANGTLLRNIYTELNTNNPLIVQLNHIVQENENFLVTLQAQSFTTHYLTVIYTELE